MHNHAHAHPHAHTHAYTHTHMHTHTPWPRLNHFAEPHDALPVGGRELEPCESKGAQRVLTEHSRGTQRVLEPATAALEEFTVLTQYSRRHRAAPTDAASTIAYHIPPYAMSTRTWCGRCGHICAGTAVQQHAGCCSFAAQRCCTVESAHAGAVAFLLRGNAAASSQS